MAKMRFELNRKGLGEVLTRPAAIAFLEAQGSAAVASSGGVLVAETGVSLGGGGAPARARVRIGYPASMSAAQALRTEAKKGTVARALGAAGGG